MRTKSGLGSNLIDDSLAVHTKLTPKGLVPNLQALRKFSTQREICLFLTP